MKFFIYHFYPERLSKLIESLFQFTEEQVPIQSASTENLKTDNLESPAVEAADEVEMVEVHSIGCGPSPDREVEEIFTREVSVQKLNEESNTKKTATVQSQSEKVSVGTSPLPQTCGTQVSQIAICLRNIK